MFTDINVTIGEIYSLPVHESVSVGRAPVREEEGDLVRGHRHQRDEVPEHVRVLQVGRGVPLLSVDKVREQDWVPEMSSLVIVISDTGQLINIIFM